MLRFSCLLSVSLFLAGCSDTVSSRYSDFAHAKSKGALDQGWIPSILPLSSVHIEESHDLDINIGQGTFSFSGEDSEKLKNQLSIMSADEKFRRVRVDRKDLERKGYVFYTFEDFYLAINWQKSQGHFWLD